MRNVLLFLFITISFLSFAQPEKSPIVKVDGKQFYEHLVEEGNTLWGLQNQYKVSSELILATNPQLKEGLKVGQKVLIPIQQQEVSATTETTNYKVQKKETLYGLSRKFNVSVDQLIALNPELKEGLKKGQIIKVPYIGETEKNISSVVSDTPNPFVNEENVSNELEQAQAVEFSDSVINHVVLAHETMYSISKRFMVPIEEILETNGLKSTSVKEGQVLIIPVKKESNEVLIKEVPGIAGENELGDLTFDSKDQYKVAILLPFHLDYGKTYSEYVSNLATQFYMGAKIALDDLEAKGLNAKVQYYDTKNDSTAVRAILNSSSFDEVDLVIGPLLDNTAFFVAEFCKEKSIRMVCPVNVDAEILKNNRLIYASVPSNITQMEGMARFMLEEYVGDNIILIKPTDKGSMPLYESFRKTFNETVVDGAKPTLIETTIEGFNLFIKRGVNTRFVIPTTDRSTAMKFMNNLNRSSFRSKADDLFIYGTKEWVGFSDINNVYKNKYNFHFVSPNYVDYYEESLEEMNRKYREEFNTDLPKMAIQGYDVLTYFCSSFFLGNDSPELLMNTFDMQQISEQDGFENKNSFIIEQEDFELLKVQ